MLCEILHTDFTEMSALRKFRFAAAMRPDHIPTHCSKSKSILTDSLLIASEFVGIYSNSNAAIAKHSLSILLRWFSIIIMINLEYWLML